MKKRILSMFLAIYMLMSLLPVPARAADSISVTVGTVTLSDGQYTSDGLTVTDTPGDSYAYLKDSTLTLHNFTYEGDGSGAGSASTPRYALSATGDLTIVLEGTNKLSLVLAKMTYKCTIYCPSSSKITIDSSTNGSLSLTSSVASTLSAGIYNKGTMVISGNAMVSANGAATKPSYGVYGTLTISGGSVIAQGASGAFNKVPVLDNYSPVVTAGSDAQSAEPATLESSYQKPYVSIVPPATSEPDPEPEIPAPPAEGEGYRIDFAAERVGALEHYEISADQIGWHTSLVAVPGATYYVRKDQSETGVPSEGTAFQLPARPAAPDAAAVCVTERSVELQSNPNWEYSRDAATWSDSAVFDGLNAATEYTFYVRIRATTDAFASEAQALTLRTMELPPEAGVGYVPNYMEEALSAEAGYAVSKDGENWQSSMKLEPAQTYYVCKVDECGVPISGMTAFTTPARPAAPEKPEVESFSDTTITVTVLNGMEYRLNEGEWVTTTDKNYEFSELKPDTTYILQARQKATRSQFAGEIVEISKKTKRAPYDPDLSGIIVTEDEITFPAEEPWWYCNPTTGSWMKIQYPLTTQTFLDNQIYALEVKLGETADAMPSKPATLVLCTPFDTPKENEGYGIDYVAESLRVQEGYEISLDGTEWLREADLLPSQSYFIRRYAQGLNAPSQSVSFRTPARPEAPKSPVVTERGSSSITIHTEDGLQYRLDEGDWVMPGEGDYTFSGLEAGCTYILQVRVAPTLDDFASLPTESEVSTLAAASAAPEVQVVRVSADTIELEENETWEYSTDGENWNRIYTFENLEPATEYTYFVRVMRSENALPSEISAITVFTAYAAPAAGEGYAVDCTEETLAVTDGYQISFDGAEWSTTADFVPGETYWIRKTASEEIPASEAVSFAIAPRPAAPVCGVADESTQGKADGSLTGITAQMEYCINGGAWQPGPAELTALAGGTVIQVRVRATETVPCSLSSIYTIGVGATLTVRFDAGGGEDPQPLTNLTYGQKITAPTTPKKDGYRFEGWYLDGDKWDFAADAVTQSMTLTANWAAVEYAITYDLAGGSAENPASYTIETDSFELAVPTREGYTFLGWNGTDLAEPTKVVVITQGSTGARSYTANWEPVEYAITYDLAGGSAENPTNYTVETETFELAPPTREGYTFLGWTGTDLDEPTKVVTITRGSSGARSYTANWQAVEYAITYDLAGGSAENPTSYTVETATFELATPTREGYTFLGWTGTDLFSASRYVTVPKGSSGDRHYTATWSAVGYTITYDLAGGSVQGNPVAFTVETETFTLNNPTKKGYLFVGWSGTGLDSIAQTVTITLGSAGNRSYTAVWQPISYAIRYDLAGGRAENPDSYTIESESFELNPPTRDGYTFAGWTGTDLYGPSRLVRIARGSTEDRSYTATWEAISYKISYDLAGGTAENPQEYTADTADFTLNAPTRKGYTFAGWTGTGLSTATAEVSIPQGSLGDRAYTAVWTPVVYTLQYDLAGGSLAGENPISYTVESEDLILQNPQKNGYDFAGWIGTDLLSASETVLIEQGSTGDRSYTATWTATSYNIFYQLNGGSVEGNPESYTIETADFSLTKPVRRGYTFAGWTGTGLQEAAQLVSIPKGSTGVRMYTATWTVNGYGISYDFAGGSASGNPAIYTTEDADIVLVNPTRAGYIFSGWTGTDLQAQTLTVTIPKGSIGERSYTAHWTSIAYTITCDPAGGEVQGNPSVYTVESEEITLNMPVREHYVFLGWIGTDLTQPTLRVTIPAGSMGDRSYSAVWQPQEYEIRYALGGGTVVGNPSVYTIESEDFTLVNPERRGYNFAGWTGTDLESPAMTVTVSKGSSGARDYTATWSVIEYTLSYDLAGGEAGANPAVYTVESAAFTLGRPQRPGYRFAGWVGTDLTEPTLDPIVAQGSTGDRSYTATWIAEEYAIRYELSGGEVSGNPASYTVQSGAIVLTNPARKGYTFTGWVGTDLPAPTMTVTIPAGSTEDRTYTAMWTIEDYTIAYDLCGGAAQENPAAYTVESGAITLNNPTRSGYLFAGWMGTDLQEPTMSVTIPQGSIGNRSYTAVWKVKTYSVLVDLAGGEAEDLPHAYTVETETFQLPLPTRKGYRFAGWIGTDLPGPTEQVMIPQGSFGNRNYTALWTAVEYPITYALQGGEVSGNPTGYTIETPAFTLINPTRVGYTFAGWIGTDQAEATQSVTVASGSTGERSYTATWIVNGYAITYDLSGGSASGNPAVYTAESAPITLVNPTRKGYTFLGWTGTELEGTVRQVTIPSGSIGERSYTAVWSLDTYRIAYEGCSENGNPTSYSVETPAFTLVNPVREGYEFLGWTGTGLTELTRSVTVPKGSAEDRVYTANWQLCEYRIQYELGGGTAEGNSDAYTIESETIRLTEPVRAGYTFVGWVGTDLFSTSKIVEIAAGSLGDRTYTAVWEKNSYEISYELCGGSVSGNPSVYTVEDARIILVNPTREGYTFAGWTGTDLREATVTVTIPAGSIGERTYVATWTLVSYDIGYDLAGGQLQPQNPASYSVESDAIVLVNPTRDGYRFAGWTGTELYGPSLTVEIPKGSLGERSYTATWIAETYRISYQLLGGLAENQTSYSIESDAFVLNNPVRPGYTFLGWTGTGLDDKTMFVTIPQGSTGERTYTAHWTTDAYRIDYDLSGGNAEGNPVTYHVESADFTLNNPIREGYIFAGWTGTNLTEPSMTVTVRQGSLGDRTYTATWNPVEYAITYDYAGGIAEENPVVYTIESLKMTLVNPTRAGYVFAGWVGTGLTEVSVQVVIPAGSMGDRNYTATWMPDSETPYRVEHYLESLTGGFLLHEQENCTGTTNAEITPAVKAYPGFTAPAAQQVVIKADGSLVVRYEYTRNRYSVQYTYEGFVPADAPNVPETEDAKYAQQLSVSHAPERIGYTFSGWSAQDVEVTEGEFLVPDHDVSFVGTWRANAYVVRFDANGGSGEMEAQRFAYDAPQALLKNAFTRAGYTFLGWAESAEGEKVYADGAEVENLSAHDGAELTLYALWEWNAPVITPSEPPVVIPPAQLDEPETHSCTSLCTICGGCLDSTCTKNACNGHKDLFRDVPQKQWYAEAVEYVSVRGLMQGMGDGEFQPNATTSRAMLAVILWRLEGMPESGKEHAFRDVEQGSWYAKAVAWAAEQKIVYGTAADAFSPNKEITREQMAAFLWRYVRYRGEAADALKSLDSFHDADRVSSYAAEALQWAYSMGLISGKTGGKLDPGGDAKRCEMASVLMRFLETYES